MDLRERHQHATRHPWETVRASFFQRLAAQYASSASSVIDVGSGDGWFAAELQRSTLPNATIVCWDTNYLPDDLTEPLPSGISRTVEQPGLRADLVLALDVIEHVADDQLFVGTTLRSVISDHGVLIASVPAHQWMFSRHDTALGHYRRYRLRQLTALLEPNFQVEVAGTLFTTLLAPRFAAVVLERLLRPSAPIAPESGWTRGSLVTSLVRLALVLDTRIASALARIGVRLPGLSVWAVCRPRPNGGPS